ncbi:VOC family protein [Aquihabitans sp. G128]|uniref:VOC family protein n=1 Tax=Aquihabitans sp. G128 TaxID=2849779 RepID=UPI001C238A77|nr:VOC family protein [Aquihabitans sp. G128]QXC59520.1 VOC family protein [Aquihabitans sp. G128]
MGLEAKNPYENDEYKSDQAGELGDLITGIDHVAYAVADLDDAIEEYREVFGILVDHRELLDGEGVEIAVLRLGGSTIQLLTPTRDDADLAEFLDEWGPGVHHVGYRVADCAQALAAVVARGLEVQDDEPVPGVLGTTTAYLHPDAFHGTLIQLVEV